MSDETAALLREERQISLPLGIVVTEAPGVTRWAARVWRVEAVLPGAAQGAWSVLRRQGERVTWHAATLDLTLYRSDTEAYRVALESAEPRVWVVMRDEGGARPEPFLVTVSAYEAQDYLDSGEELVEAVTMPPALIAWVRDFIARHHVETPFIKRRRDRARIDLSEDGKGDARVRQAADVYRAPGTMKRRLH